MANPRAVMLFVAVMLSPLAAIAGAPASSSSSLTRSAASAPGSDRVLTLKRSGGAVRLYEHGRATRSPAVRAGEPIEIAGSPGNDTLRIDFSAGNPAPDGGVVFDGGAQQGGAGDGLEVVGGRFARGHVAFTRDRPGHGHDGTIVLDGTRIAFRDLEPVTFGGTVADLVFDVPQADADNQTVLENDTANQATMSQLRSGAATFETTAFTHPSASLTINLGNDATESLSVSDDSAGVPIAVNGGSGANVLSLADGETLNDGPFAGAGGSDRLSYAAYTTPVSVDLGATAGLAATLTSDQESPATSSAATGFGTVVYDTATQTFDIDLSVSNLAPGDVTGFHIHTAAVGVNGPVRVDFLPGTLTPNASGGFTFSRTGVTLPAAFEAALLGGGAYLNVHTAAFPTGAIRGQLLPGAFVDTLGTSTATGYVTNVENVTGGSAADSIVASNLANDILGGDGADTIVPVRGDDTVAAGGADDLITWSEGDGSDVIDGDGGSDRVQVNGSDGAAGDEFNVRDSEARVVVDRSVPSAISLDVGTTEALAIVGRGGDDGVGYSDNPSLKSPLARIELHGFDGADSLSNSWHFGVITLMRGGPGSDTVYGAGPWQIGPGRNMGSTQGFQAMSFDTTENLYVRDIGTFGGPAVVVAEGAGLSGTLDMGSGGSGIDHTIDFSAYASPVRVNLGSTVTTLKATLGSDQEVPPTASSATGSATLAYDKATGTFDIALDVANLDTSAISGFHLHSAAIGTNGPVIVDLASLVGPLPAGTGFTASLTNVALPVQQTAALLGGAVYVNVHSTTFPDGALRGQLLADTTAVDAPGSATGFGAIVGITSVIGGAASDSLVGSNGVNTLRGGGGADTIVPAGGADMVSGGAGDDLIAWNNGDGNDTLDGDANVDRLQVNGSHGTVGDGFSASESGSRLRVARSGTGAYAQLDVGTTEKVAVAGNDGPDVMTSTGLPDVDTLGELVFHGGNGDDILGLVPSTTVTATQRGGPGADKLRFDPGCLAVTSAAGSLTAADRRPVNHASVETVDVASAVRFAAESGSFSEADGAAVIGVTRNGTAAGSVNYTTSPLTALAGIDYTTTAGTLTIGSGAGSPTIGVPLARDGTAEGPETFQVFLHSPGPFTNLCSPSQFTATITNAPPPLTPAPPPPPPAAAPAVRFAITSIVPSSRTGRARVSLRLPRRGNVSIVGRRATSLGVVARVTARRRGPGVLRVTLKPTALGLRLLRRTGRLSTRVTATFTPTAGARLTARRTVTLRLARRR